MKRFISRAVAVILTCVLAFGSSVCFAADSTESADAKKYYDYGTYVLLGDSVASGHNDLVYVDSEFKRVENSYGAYVADALGVNYVPMACPGFRTIDIRYMLEDDYPGDDYLFHDSHNPEVMKSRIPEYRRAISQAGLITLGVGGNDFGTSETQFSPDSALTKLALVQALYGMAGSPEVNTDNLSFADLDSSNPAFKAAVWAVSNGIVKASDGKFEPDSEISVADFGLTMIRFSAKVDFNLKRVVKTVSMSFNLALENKFMIIKRSITRAQAAQKLAGYRYY